MKNEISFRWNNWMDSWQ